MVLFVGKCWLFLLDFRLKLHIHPTTEWKEQPNRTSTGQAVAEDVSTDVLRLVSVIGKEQLSAKEIMEKMGLKGRDNFLSRYLAPAVKSGFVALCYPDKPRHPRQKYLLTAKGEDLCFRQ